MVHKSVHRPVHGPVLARLHDALQSHRRPSAHDRNRTCPLSRAPQARVSLPAPHPRAPVALTGTTGCRDSNRIGNPPAVRASAAGCGSRALTKKCARTIPCGSRFHGSAFAFDKQHSQELRECRFGRANRLVPDRDTARYLTARKGPSARTPSTSFSKKGREAVIRCKCEWKRNLPRLQTFIRRRTLSSLPNCMLKLLSGGRAVDTRDLAIADP